MSNQQSRFYLSQDWQAASKFKRAIVWSIVSSMFFSMAAPALAAIPEGTTFNASSVAVGTSSIAPGTNDVAIGQGAEAGKGTLTNKDNATAIGANSKAGAHRAGQLRSQRSV